MDIELYRNYCLEKPGVTEEFPFDNRTLVFKVCGKMFSLLDIESFDSVNLKCDPEKAIQLREHYPGVLAGYHMNKKHWNTVNCDGSISDKLILEWTNDSYNLVLNSLPIRIRKEINQNQ
jgi:predicted DNA-binding protein (MmcQ/YjbR family)